MFLVFKITLTIPIFPLINAYKIDCSGFPE